MKALSCLLWFALAASSWGQTLHFGTNVVNSGQMITFSAPPNARARAEAGRASKPIPWVKGGVMLPLQCTNLARPCPLLVFSVPSGGSAIPSMRSVTNVALSEGWAIFAAEGPKLDPNDDTIQWGWGILSSALDQFYKTWPPAKQWPVACVGFSGGAKRSAAVAAAMSHDGWRVIGVFMGGCNEDRATLGQQLFQPGASFKGVPMFLSNGESDPIANPEQGAAVRDSMIRSGFMAVRLETYAGQHQLSQEHLREALCWFMRPTALR